MSQKPPKLELENVWVARLTSRELTLIRKALRRELAAEHHADADALEAELARMTVAETKNKLDIVDKLARNLRK